MPRFSVLAAGVSLIAFSTLAFAGPAENVVSTACTHCNRRFTQLAEFKCWDAGDTNPYWKLRCTHCGHRSNGSLKPIVHETIGQNPPGLSYPSGHTTNVFTIIAIVAVLLASPPPGWPARRTRIALVAIAILIGCVVIVALIVIRFHYFTDTAGGVCVATGVVVGFALLLDLPAPRATMTRWLRRVHG